jgi:hypothetical protein
MRRLGRLISVLSRAGTAVAIALLVLAACRLAPVAAEPPLDVRALALAPPLLALSVTAALTGRERRRTRWRVAGVALVAAAGALALVAVARGPSGLAGEVSGASGVVGSTPAGPIEVVGRDLRALVASRTARVRWAGELRAPESGRYRLRASGRGQARVLLGGRPLIEASGDPLDAAVDVGLSRGPSPLEVEATGPLAGLRLRLEWTRPDGRTETIPSRFLGPARPRGWWVATDALALLAATLAGLLAWLAPWDRPRRPPAPRPATWSELAVVGAALLALLAVMSWPLVLDLVHTGPMDRPDGRLNAWILAWAGKAFWTAPARLFQAPSFHPLPDNFAFSENLLLPGVLAYPLQPLLGPVFAYDATLLASLLLSGLGTYLLVRRVSGDRLAAFVGAAYFAAGPHRWTRMSHLHAQMTAFLPFALLALDRFWERRTLRRALVVGLLLAAQGLASVYLGAITAAALAVAVLVALFGGLRPRELALLALGFLLAAAILWPVTRPYLRMREFQGQEFTLEMVAYYAASWPSYAAAGTAAWGRLSQRLLDPGSIRDTLFPGLAALALGIAGLAAAPRRFRAVAVAASAVAILFSLGPDTAFYRFLHEHLVLVRGVRALARFALVPTLALAVLAGLALAGRRRLAVLGALAVMMFESQNLPLRLARYDGPSPAARWLAGGEGAVLVLPLALDDTRAMLDGLAHGRPLVNGDSGFIPRPFDRAMELLADGLSPEGLRLLRAVDVRHVVAPLATREGFQPGDRWPEGTREVARLEAERVGEVMPGPRARAVEAGEPVPTRWTAQGLVATLPEARPVGRVAFVLSDAEWVENPLVETSADGLAWTPVEATASLADATLSLYRSPTGGRGEVRFAPVTARFLRLDPRVPARPEPVEVGSAGAVDPTRGGG